VVKPISAFLMKSRQVPGRVAAAVICASVMAVISTASWAEAVSTCAVALSPDEALRRLNHVRLRGAACRPTATPTTAQPLTWNEELAAAALQQAREMALQKRMSHRDRENRGLAERLRATGYRFSAAAENLAVGYPSLDVVVDAWIQSEGHCENLLNGAVIEVGIACVDAGPSDAPEEGRYWTLVLGAPARSR
jgi:uncharacterized protein YkwD